MVSTGHHRATCTLDDDHPMNLRRIFGILLVSCSIRGMFEMFHGVMGFRSLPDSFKFLARLDLGFLRMPLDFFLLLTVGLQRCQWDVEDFGRILGVGWFGCRTRCSVRWNQRRWPRRWVEERSLLLPLLLLLFPPAPAPPPSCSCSSSYPYPRGRGGGGGGEKEEEE